MRWVAAMFVLCLAFAGGCAPPVLMASAGLNAVEEGTAAFIRSEMRTARNVPIDMAWQATIDALEELGYAVKNSGMRERYAFVIARDAGDTPVTVRLHAPTPVLTKIKVRIGVFGDGAISQVIMDRILARLPTTPPAGPAPPHASPATPRPPHAPPPDAGDPERQ